MALSGVTEIVTSSPICHSRLLITSGGITTTADLPLDLIMRENFITDVKVGFTTLVMYWKDLNILWLYDNAKVVNK